MCLAIDESVKTLNKRTVWKVFDKETGRIASLFRGFVYPKGKLIERSRGPTSWALPDGTLQGTNGLHFYTSKAKALNEAKDFHDTYIAKFEVDPKDFMYANSDRSEAMYERARRVGNYIKVAQA